jgi:hypothetical protein
MRFLIRVYISILITNAVIKSQIVNIAVWRFSPNTGPCTFPLNYKMSHASIQQPATSLLILMHPLTLSQAGPSPRFTAVP